MGIENTDADGAKQEEIAEQKDTLDTGIDTDLTLNDPDDTVDGDVDNDELAPTTDTEKFI